VIVNASAFELAFPLEGVITFTEAEPAVAISAAVIAAVSLVALTKFVALFDPFHWTVESLKKPEPFTVRVNAAPKACVLAGDSEERLKAMMVKGSWLLEGTPACTTATVPDPAEVRSLAASCALICVALE